jgi:subtilisin family serine protease
MNHQRPTRFIRTLGLSVLAALSLTQGPAMAQSAPRPFVSKPITNQYIVTFRAQTNNPGALASELARQSGGRLLNSYSHAIKGFSVRLPAKATTALAALRNNPNVERVEADATVQASETAISPPLAQNSATWGLDRIDQVDLPLSSQYLYQYQSGEVQAFVVDTGILASHQDFGGRVGPGMTAINDGFGTSDCNGHGTHVAGTIGGAQWGVAKRVNLVPVRVLDCAGSGSWSGVIAGLDWVAAQTALRPAVANLSLGGGYSKTVNAAVAGAVAKGVIVVVAAGNSATDACTASPASEPSALTVGATGSNDARASYSNYGTCLDLFAPGSGITSAWYTGPAATNTISGTSMASPHVAGAAALVLASNPQATPVMVGSFLTENASLNKVVSAGTGSPNRLLYALANGAPQAPATVTVSVASLTGNAVLSGKANWVAQVEVRVRDSVGNAVPYATVGGSFNPGGAKSCVTTSTGACTLISSALSRKRVANTTLSVTGISGANLVYAADQNSAVQIRVARP